MKSIFTILFSAIAAISLAQSSKSGNYHVDENHKISAKGTLRLLCSDAKVYISGSDRTDVNIKIDRQVEIKGFNFGTDEFTVDITENDGNISIRERSSSSHVGFVNYHETYTIKILAPKSISLVLDGDDGDYFVTNIDGNIDADLDDADIELTGCDGSDFKFRLDDGDVKMDSGKGSLAIDGDDADVTITNGHFTSIQAEMDDGSFMVETSLLDNGDYYINSQDGRITFTVTSGGGRFDIRHDDASIRADANFASVEESEDRSRFTLGSGNAKVDIRADDASVKLAKR